MSSEVLVLENLIRQVMETVTQQETRHRQELQTMQTALETQLKSVRVEVQRELDQLREKPVWRRAKEATEDLAWLAASAHPAAALEPVAVTHLLEDGADVYHYLCRRSETVSGEAGVKPQLEPSRPILHTLVARGCVPAVQAILVQDRPVDLTAVDGAGCTVLHLLCTACVDLKAARQMLGAVVTRVMNPSYRTFVNWRQRNPVTGLDFLSAAASNGRLASFWDIVKPVSFYDDLAEGTIELQVDPYPEDWIKLSETSKRAFACHRHLKLQEEQERRRVAEDSAVMESPPQPIRPHSFRDMTNLTVMRGAPKLGTPPEQEPPPRLSSPSHSPVSSRGAGDAGHPGSILSSPGSTRVSLPPRMTRVQVQEAESVALLNSIHSSVGGGSSLSATPRGALALSPAPSRVVSPAASEKTPSTRDGRPAPPLPRAGSALPSPPHPPRSSEERSATEELVGLAKDCGWKGLPLERVKACVACGADVMALAGGSDHSVPLLSQFIEVGPVELVGALLQTRHPIDFTITDVFGWTPLHYIPYLSFGCKTDVEVYHLLHLLVDRVEAHPEDILDWGKLDKWRTSPISIAARWEHLATWVEVLFHERPVRHFTENPQKIHLTRGVIASDWEKMRFGDQIRFIVTEDDESKMQ